MAYIEDDLKYPVLTPKSLIRKRDINLIDDFSEEHCDNIVQKLQEQVGKWEETV